MKQFITRRQFTACAAGTLFAGCRNGATNTPGVPAFVEDPTAPAAQARRDEHWKMLQAFKVPGTASRTTTVAINKIEELSPALKAIGKQTVRLHPRFGTEPGQAFSKMGGRCLWPLDEPWPTDASTGVALAPILQLTREDAPNNFAFREGCDLLQVLWLPRAELRPVVAWRKRSQVGDQLAPPPSDKGWNQDYVPVPCLLFPERVMDFPSVSVLPETMKQALGTKESIYAEQFAAVHGSKVGGYPVWPGDMEAPACITCKWGMDFLASICSAEWRSPRWRPREEAKDEPGYQRAHGLHLRNEQDVNLFVCRRCADWPVRFAVV